MAPTTAGNSQAGATTGRRVGAASGDLAGGIGGPGGAGVGMGGGAQMWPGRRPHGLWSRGLARGREEVGHGPATGQKGIDGHARQGFGVVLGGGVVVHPVCDGTWPGTKPALAPYE